MPWLSKGWEIVLLITLIEMSSLKIEAAMVVAEKDVQYICLSVEFKVH